MRRVGSLVPARPRHAPALALLGLVVVVGLLVREDAGTLATAIVAGIYAAVALPLGLLYGQGGVLTVAQGTFAALGAYAAGILATKTGLSPEVALLVAIVIPAVVAGALALPILRLPLFALVIATLAFATIVEEIAARAELTGGRVGMTGVFPVDWIGTDVTAYFVIWFAVVLMVAGYTNLATASRGRALNAVRVDETLALSAGVNVKWELASIFALAAGASGAAGWFYVHYIGFIAPESLSFNFSAAVLLMVIVGGRRAVLGPIVGALFYILARDNLPFSPEALNLVFGLLLVVILVFLPNGLASLPKLLSRRVSAWSQRGATPSVGAQGGSS